MTLISQSHEGGLPIQASGGTTVTTFTDTNGDEYRIHAFESVGSDTFSVDFVPFYGPKSTVDVLVVGGGGGAANRHGGGGGAGGLIFEQALSVAPSNFIINVGDGGPGFASGQSPDTGSGSGTAGENTTAFGLTALGGGAGDGGGNGGSFSNGGSGGGGDTDTGEAGQGLQPTSADGGFGNDGGIGVINTQPFAGGGGGGATQPGDDATPIDADSADGGDGGDGKDFSSKFGTSFGENGFFAGGGGGGSDEDGSSRSSGGIGGGGDGLAESPFEGEDGQANTGGGGGGAGFDGDTDFHGGDGGSGIVLIRYEI